MRSLAWLALILGFLGFSKLAELSFAFLERFGYMLLSIPLPTFYFEDQVFELPEEFLNPNVLPQEALWLALMLTLLFIYLSGRLLQEVEL